MKSIILLGAPGAGKGTVAKLIADATDYQHVSTGDMLRQALKDETEVGLKAKSFMEAGALVPDDVILGIVKAHLEAGSSEAQYMFDGFPRTMDQAQGLDAVMQELNGTLENVFQLDVDREILIDRAAGRRICKTCGAVYHVRNIPPKEEGICDNEGEALVQRPDDDIEVVKNRLEVYKQQTESLIDYYDQKGVLVHINAAVDRMVAVADVMGHLN